ncbi:MAG: GNAT family N-acetyltransferase [Candidatus Eisenbacteria bacterium]
MSTVTVAAATPADVPLLYGLIRQLAIYEKLESAMVSTEADLAEGLFGPRPAAEAIVASLDGSAVGYALFFRTYSTFLGRPGLYLEDLFVLPEARGAGAGKALLARLAAITLERGCGRLDWVVLDWNKPAIGFYKRIGAESMDEWTTNRLTGAALERLARGDADRS